MVTGNENVGIPVFIRAASKALFVALLCLIAAEVSVRLIVSQVVQYDIEMWKYATVLKRTSGNPRIGHEHVPSKSAHLMGVDVEINSLGLRDAEYSVKKPDGAYRILFLGDSITFGWGVPYGDRVSELLEASWNEDILVPRIGYNRIEVINAGVGNYNSSMAIEWYIEKGGALDPDAVVLNYFVNDAEPTVVRKGNLLSEWSNAFVWISGRIGQLLRYGGDDWRSYYARLYQPGSPGLRTVTESVGRLVAHCRKRGTRLLIVNYPELHQLEDYPFAAATDFVRDLAEKHSVAFVDLHEAVRGEVPESLWVALDDPHPNSVANGLYADYLRPYLDRLLPPAP